MSGIPAGAATGVGSLPGTNPAEACRVVLGELPDLPHLAELPARGPGAQMIGRTAALLVDLSVDLQPSGWRLVDRPGLDLRRARDLLARDLDALEESAQDYRGPLKVQSAGPWTLAAAVELTRGDKVLADLGAVRDLTTSLAEGLAAHVADLHRRLPGVQVVVQLDEPSLPAVLAGQVATASGFGALRAVPAADAEAGLQTVLTTAATAAPDAVPAVHCCARNAPVGLLVAAGARAVGLDLSARTARDDDALGEAVEAGVVLMLGVVPGSDAALPDLAGSVAPVRALWRRLGFTPERLASAVVPTPTCGLAGASPAYARAALARVREVGRVLVEDPEGSARG